MTGGRDVIGLLSQGKSSIGLMPGVRGIISVTIGSRGLVRRPWYTFDESCGGIPVAWDERGDRLYVWPTPDATYQTKMSWTGVPSNPWKIPMRPEWVAMYKHELAAALKMMGSA